MLHLLRLAARRTVVWAAILGALAVLLAFVPLFQVLGYELSFAVAIVASFAAADLGAAQVRRAPDAGLLGHVVAAWARMLLVLLVPLATILVASVFVRPCDTAGGLVFYLAMPGLSTLFGSVAGVVCAAVLRRRPFLGALAAWLTVVGSLALGVYRFYAAPPIFGYDPFAGYFPGAVYDENIRLGAAFWWARLYQAAWATAALGVAGFARGRRAAAAAALGGTLAALLLLHRSADLGFHVTASDMAAALGGRRDTAHFVVYYPRGAPFEKDMDAIAQDHEFRYAQVVRAFGVAPKGKIASFYFANAADKASWMGAESAYIAKPWRREIYLSHDDFPHPALRHEIAHVVAGVFGDALFHVSVKWWAWPPAQFNVGLIEGAAVAADWPASPSLTPHQSVRAMIELGVLPPLRQTLAPSFFTFTSAQGYTTAGSFCAFLIARYGVERFRSLYRSGGLAADFARIYGRPLEDLEAEWRAEAMAVPLAERDREIARERFRGKGIFHRPCPHAVAALRARAQDLAKRGDAPAAAALWQRVCAEDPEPGHRFGLAAALERAGDVDAAARILGALAANTELSTPLRARAGLALIDLFARRGKHTAARVVMEVVRWLPVDEATERNIAVRKLALDRREDPLLDYLFAPSTGDDATDAVLQLARAERVAQHMPLGHYLVGRLLWAKGEWAEAKRRLALAAAGGLELPLVARANDWLLVSSAFLSGDLATARAAAERLARPEQPLATRLWAADWLERIRFRETGSLSPNPTL